MLEWYRAFCGYEPVLRDTERLVSDVVTTLSGTRHLDVRGTLVDMEPPFLRLTMRAAFAEHAGVSDALELAQLDEDHFFELLVSQVEPALAEYPKPVFITEYPLCQAALARPCPHEPRAADRFELYVAGVELCNGFAELTDPHEQRRRFEAELERRQREREPAYPIDERFLDALNEGMPRAAGNALGLDRLVMLALGAESISEVMAFPDAWK